MTGVPASPSGSRASHEAAISVASSPEASIPNAAFGGLIARCELGGGGDQIELLEEAFELCFPKPTRIWVTDNSGAWTPEYAEYHERSWRFNEVMEAGAFLDAARKLLAPHTLWAVGSMEDGPFARVCWPLPGGGYSGGYDESRAPSAALALCAVALKARRDASAIEARRAATPESDAVHESATRQGDAQ